MKYQFFLLFIFATTLNAQSILKFDKRFVQSEDKWVAFMPDKDSSYLYGFIYIDEHAGLTLNYEGTFTITQAGKFVPKKLDSTNMKIRLRPNKVLVAFIPEYKFQELEISATPEWLKYYKIDTNSITRLYNWGYTYNGWGECSKALTYLERAKKIDSTFKGLGVELAYSYNCLGQYDNAVVVLQSALQTNPTDAYTNKELIYAQIKSGQLEKASLSCKNAIAVCPDKTYNGENSYNLLYAFYQQKDKVNFNLWVSEAKKWNAKTEELIKSIVLMESELNK